jgi:hypothetical protein
MNLVDAPLRAWLKILFFKPRDTTIDYGVHLCIALLSPYHNRHVILEERSPRR